MRGRVTEELLFERISFYSIISDVCYNPIDFLGT